MARRSCWIEFFGLRNFVHLDLLERRDGLKRISVFLSADEDNYCRMNNAPRHQLYKRSPEDVVDGLAGWQPYKLNDIGAIDERIICWICEKLSKCTLQRADR